MTWAGKILRVDLTNGTCNSRAAEHGVGARVHRTARPGHRNTSSKRSTPRSIRCRLQTRSSGPLARLPARWPRPAAATPSSPRAPLTGAIACSNSGGYWGAELKMAGWDMIIFEGKCAQAGLSPHRRRYGRNSCDAEWLWGKSVWDTEQTIKEQHQDPQIRVSLHRACGRDRAACTPRSSTTSIAPPDAPAWAP